MISSCTCGHGAEKLGKTGGDSAAQEVLRIARRRRIPLRSPEWVVQAILTCTRPEELPPLAPQGQLQDSPGAALPARPPSKRPRRSSNAPAAAAAADNPSRRKSAAAAVPARAADGQPQPDAASEDDGFQLTPEFTQPKQQQQPQQRQQLECPQSPENVAGAAPAEVAAAAEVVVHGPAEGPPPGLGLPATQFRTYYSSFTRVRASTLSHRPQQMAASESLVAAGGAMCSSCS